MKTRMWLLAYDNLWLDFLSRQRELYLEFYSEQCSFERFLGLSVQRLWFGDLALGLFGFYRLRGFAFLSQFVVLDLGEYEVTTEAGSNLGISRSYILGFKTQGDYKLTVGKFTLFPGVGAKVSSLNFGLGALYAVTPFLYLKAQLHRGISSEICFEDLFSGDEKIFLKLGLFNFGFGAVFSEAFGFSPFIYTGFLKRFKDSSSSLMFFFNLTYVRNSGLVYELELIFGNDPVFFLFGGTFLSSGADMKAGLLLRV